VEIGRSVGVSPSFELLSRTGPLGLNFLAEWIEKNDKYPAGFHLSLVKGGLA
jgi:hypothetical protein